MEKVLNNFLTGSIYITNSIDVIRSIQIEPNTRIINLDEDLVNTDSNFVIGGTCLLPPIEAKMAESDGYEKLYDDIYVRSLTAPFQTEFFTALIAFLRKGGKLILFLPDDPNAFVKLPAYIMTLYGIHIGIIGAQDPLIANSYYNNAYLYIWLNLLYTHNIISAFEYLYLFPMQLDVNNNAITNKLIVDIKPFGNNYSEQINSLIRLQSRIKENRNLIIPIRQKI